MSVMRLGERGESLIKRFEDLQLTSYRLSECDPWKIGYGHTRNVYEGMTITQVTADAFFDNDVLIATEAINSIGVNLTQSMFDAITSLCVDVGIRAISGRSTIGKAIRIEDWVSAWRGFSLWLSTSDDLAHQTRRRASEMVLFSEDGLVSAS